MGGTSIETARLALRPHTLADYEAVTALWQEPQVFHHISGKPLGREDSWHRLLRFAGHWAWFGHGMFVAEDRATGRLAGEVGLADFHRGLGSDFDGPPEAAWVMAPWAQGQGLAHEAMEALLAWAAGHLDAARAVCVIDPANTPSVALAGRLGFVAMRTSVYRDHPATLFERPFPKPVQAG